jgi:hypothetical protein
MSFLDKKDFLIVKKLKALNYENNAIDSFIYNQSTVYDFFDKKASHFSTLQPYQFMYRINYSYDCFLLSMHYDLVLTYNICHFSLGSTVKARVDFPFYKFNRWFPFRLNTNKLIF